MKRFAIGALTVLAIIVSFSIWHLRGEEDPDRGNQLVENETVSMVSSKTTDTIEPDADPKEQRPLAETKKLDPVKDIPVPDVENLVFLPKAPDFGTPVNLPDGIHLKIGQSWRQIFYSPDDKRVAYLVIDGNQIKVCLQEVNSHTTRELYRGDDKEGMPDDLIWFPDGSRLALSVITANPNRIDYADYVAGCMIFVSDVRTDNIKYIPIKGAQRIDLAGIGNDNWLYFVKHGNGEIGLYKIEPDSSEPQEEKVLIIPTLQENKEIEYNYTRFQVRPHTSEIYMQRNLLQKGNKIGSELMMVDVNDPSRRNPSLAFPKLDSPTTFAWDAEGRLIAISTKNGLLIKDMTTGKESLIETASKFNIQSFHGDKILFSGTKQGLHSVQAQDLFRSDICQAYELSINQYF